MNALNFSNGMKKTVGWMMRWFRSTAGPSKSSRKQNANAHGRCRTAGVADRPQRVAGPTGWDCVSGVDLAVRRRIKWLIGVAGRGEGVKRSAPPPPAVPPVFSLSLPQPAEKAIGAEQTNHMAIKHDSPPLHWDSIQTAFTGLCSVLIPAFKRRTQTHANAHRCIHTHTPPSLPINMTVVLQVPTVWGLLFPK